MEEPGLPPNLSRYSYVHSPAVRPLFTMKSPFDSLGRFPLSIILSYLTETEGTSFLLTRKRYAYQLLPQFRAREGILNGLMVRGGHKRRHHFFVAPVQDPNVLLDRLNTHRLYKRKQRPVPGLSTMEIATREWRDIRTTICSSKIAPTLMLLRFLDRNDELQQHTGTLLVSYPRSGNTLLRTLLERITGIVTGSDTRPDRNLSRELAERHGLVGEGVVATTTQKQASSSSSRVLFVKSHWPERVGCQAYPIKRAVLLIRNPYDAFDSYWNLNATKSHTQTLTDAVYERFRDKFERLVRNEIHVWMKFHGFWLGGDSCQVPVLVVRFEDLIQNPAEQLERVMKFSLDFETEQLSSFWRNQIASVTDESTEKLGSYRPRSGAKSIGKSIHKGRYSTELLDYLRVSASQYPINYLQEFGYELVQGGFPFTVPPLPIWHTSTLRPSSSSSGIQINVGKTVRPIECEFGRAMQQWRWSVTDHDKKPLPTVGCVILHNRF